jgi:hypothetical protein
MKITQKDGFFTIQLKDCQRHFLTAWEAIAYLSKINLLTQKN